MEKLSRNLLKKAVIKAGVNNQVEAVSILEEFKNIIINKWGKDVSYQIMPLYFKNQILYIQILNSGFSHEIKIHEGEILKQLNNNLNNFEEVKEIKFKV
ncbi:MAG: DciA family protein [Patescibacteria group bacterium]